MTTRIFLKFLAWRVVPNFNVSRTHFWNVQYFLSKIICHLYEWNTYKCIAAAIEMHIVYRFIDKSNLAKNI